MDEPKEIARRVPGLQPAYCVLRRLYAGIRFKHGETERIFRAIGHQNRWKGRESLSGPGSGLDQTTIVRRTLRRLIKELGVSALLDIPCGDFHWMSRLDLTNVEYCGADVVRELVDSNRIAYQRANVSFRHLNLLRSELPKADLIICRDCLVHFSFADVFSALSRMLESGSGYVLTTTFPSLETNRDISTGQWRRINLELEPFCLPKPQEIVNEEYTEREGRYRDKSLGLWKISELQACLRQ